MFVRSCRGAGAAGADYTFPMGASRTVCISSMVSNQVRRLRQLTEATLRQRQKDQVFDRLCIDVWRAELSGERAHRAAGLIIELASLRTGSRVVDFGCGIGQIALKLAQQGVRVTGIDRSHDAIAEARSTAGHSLTVFIETDWRAYVSENTFDCALFWYTTLCSGHELDLDLEALSTARRSLHNAGVLLVETRHWDRMERRLLDIAGAA